MARLPYAATMLIGQVQAHHASADAKVADDPDGLNVHRTIKFDKRTSKWLAPLLAEVDDPRIADLNTTEAGYLHVTFIPGPGADSRDPFPLEDAAEVVRSHRVNKRQD